MPYPQDYRGSDHNTPEAFSRYLRQLAADHVCLADSETEPHFFRGELEEFYMGFRDRLNFPALVQEGSEIRFTTDAAQNAFKERESSFIIVQNYAEEGDYDAIYAAFDTCERIGDEIIRRMNLDKFEAECMVVKDFKLEDVTAIQLQNVKERYVGVRYSFVTRTPFWDEIDTRKWR